MLPTFIVAGAGRSSTTSLHSYLSAHPEIFMSPKKETDFFSFVNKDVSFSGPFDEGFADTIITNQASYEQLFDAAPNVSAIGETSPSYLFFPAAANNIFQLIPNAKVIITLRNPADRAFSNYLQHVMLGHEHESFETALALEQERADAGWRWAYQYRQESLYAHKVKHYFDVFGRDNVSVHLFEDLRANPVAELSAICRLLDVNANYYETYNFIKKNQSGLPRSKVVHNFLRQDNIVKRATKPFMPSRIRKSIHKFLSARNYAFDDKPVMLEDTRSELRAYFKHDCLALEALLGRDLSSWYEE